MNTRFTHRLRRGIASLGLAALCIGLLPSAASAQNPIYRVTNLGTLYPPSKSKETDYATAMSSDGSKVVGQVNVTASNGRTTTSYFYWDGAMHTLTPPPNAFVRPWYVTPSGLVLQQSPPFVYVWTLSGGLVTLPNGGSSAGASGMNDAGVIVGSMDDTHDLLGNDPTTGAPFYARIPMRWERNTSGQWTYMNLGRLAGHNAGQLSRIDSNGNITGLSFNESMSSTGNAIQTDIHMVLWSPSDGFVPHDLGQPGMNPLVLAFQTDPTTLATQFVFRVDANSNRMWYTNGIATTALLGTDTTNPYMNANGLTKSGQVSGTAGFAGAHHACYWDTDPPPFS